MISVIIPVYNVAPFLSRCVDSVLSQAHVKEILLIDDGSTDASKALCDKYAAQDSRVKVLHKENGGLSSARNAGLDLATGDYISFVDSDDFLEPEAYEKLLSCARGHRKQGKRPLPRKGRGPVRPRLRGPDVYLAGHRLRRLGQALRPLPF